MTAPPIESPHQTPEKQAPRATTRKSVTVAITADSRARRAVTDAMADMRADVGLDALSSRVSERVLRYASTIGLVTPASPDRRGDRVDWWTRSGLGILVQSAEVIASHIVRETGDSCDLDAFALRRLARRWRSWGAATYAAERARRRAA